jgi:hypothetical protein
VVLDDDLVALEWVKNAVREEFDPVHIFQHMDQALSRVRQYLVRGQPPVLLVSPEAQVDAMVGMRDTLDFIARLKEQSSGMTILWLHEDGEPEVTRRGVAEGVVTRPEKSQLRLTEGEDDGQVRAGRFLQQLQSALGSEGGQAPESAREGEQETPPDSLGNLRDATRALTDACSRGEILPVAIRFAAETFSRVAMVLVHDGAAVGIAEAGLSRAGGPDEEALRAVHFDVDASGWLTAVLTEGKPVTSAPMNEGDRLLAGLLGDQVPAEVYIGPIESMGQVIALLYGDNLPGGEPIGDTSALEVVLHHAGLALDRAALERALQEHAAQD